jgi:RNA polymerase sigma factor (sigma-70 family)
MSTVEVVESSDSAVYEAFRDELVRFAAAIVGRDTAEDVLSTVMLRIMSRRHLADLRGPRPYLYKAVLHEARSQLRSRNRRDSLARAVVTQPQPVPGDSPESLALDADVREAVLALPTRQRAATYLTYWKGCSIAETAALMGCRPGTVSRYLHLARRHLRRALNGT